MVGGRHSHECVRRLKYRQFRKWQLLATLNCFQRRFSSRYSRQRSESVYRIAVDSPGVGLADESQSLRPRIGGSESTME